MYGIEWETEYDSVFCILEKKDVYFLRCNSLLDDMIKLSS